MFLLLPFTFLLCTSPVEGSRPSPFELYPPTNSATPVPYEKKAPAIPADTSDWPYKGGEKVAVTIDAGQVLHKVTPYQFGNNVAWWNHKDWFLDPDRIEKAKQSGIRFWRWPGGSSSDNYHWDGDYSWHKTDHEGGDPSHMSEDYAVHTDDFIEFCRQTGSEAIVTANFGASRYGTPEQAADLAARWVKYFNFEKKFKVRYWEIGNEMYGGWEEGNKIAGQMPLTGDLYAENFKIIADAMRKADPDIYIGAVAVETDAGDDWTGYGWWTQKLLGALGSAADYLIIHQYFMWPYDGGHNYSEPTNETILGNIPKIADSMRSMERMQDKYTDPPARVPVALTEYNILNGSVPPTIELINGLFTAEVLGETVKAGYACSNYWDWRNGLDEKEHGDHAMLSSNDPDIPDATPRPSYYAYAAFARAFGQEIVAAESSDPSVKIYASRFSGGELGMVVVNEKGQNAALDLSLTGTASPNGILGWVLSGDDLNSRRVSWNGMAGPSGGGGPFPLDTIPPYLVKFGRNQNPIVTVPPFSVTGLVIF